MKLLLLIIIVMSLILGPMMMMRPSPAQKKRERWHGLASAKGIRFTLRQLPQQATEQEKPVATSVYFFPPDDNQPRQDWGLIRATYAHELHFLNWWVWQGQNKASFREMLFLETALSSAPEGVRGLSCGAQGICIYWDEKGGDNEFEWVVNTLVSLQQLSIHS